MTTTNTATAASIHFQLIGNERGRTITILDGQTMNAGTRASWCTPFATIRRWAADAAAHGVTDIRLCMSRHTRDLGRYNGISFGNGHETAPRGRRFAVRLDVAPLAFDAAR